jgi:hypothetical protein
MLSITLMTVHTHTHTHKYTHTHTHTQTHTHEHTHTHTHTDEWHRTAVGYVGQKHCNLRGTFEIFSLILAIFSELLSDNRNHL